MDCAKDKTKGTTQNWEEDHFYLIGQKVYGNDMTRALK